MADFNNDNTKIEAALHGLAEQAAGKADAAALTAAVNRVSALENGKADKTALSAEQSAREGADSAERTARQNADNAEKAAREAADAALDKRAGMQLIKTFSLSEENRYFLFTMDNVDWSAWSTVHLVMKPVLDSGVKYNCDGGSPSMNLGGYRSGHFHIVLYPTFDPQIAVIGHYWPKFNGDGYLCGPTLFQNFPGISFSADGGNFQAGTTVTVWGAK